MPREFTRSRRIEPQVQRILAELLLREVKDPRVRGVNVTAVELAADLGVARVYFSLLEPDADPQPVAEALAAAAGFLRTQLGRRLPLRQVPQLRFQHDTSAAEGSRMSTLISEARRRDQEGI